MFGSTVMIVTEMWVERTDQIETVRQYHVVLLLLVVAGNGFMYRSWF